MSDKKVLYLLDAFALIYRAYFAFSKNPRINSAGQNTSAVLGFTNSLIEVLQKYKPSHLAVVFDAPVATNRELEYTDYKANREEMPEDIRWAIPYIKQVIEGFNIPVLLSEGFEADDVIGTLAKEAERRGFTTYMMTPDKDFGQLVSPNIFMHKPPRMGKPAEIMGVPEVCAKFEVETPEQVIDILGLWGDAVDNIPGIPGIGEKTAKKLIGQYGSVENLIAHADELKGKQKENVINFAEQGLLSKKLATIILDVPIDFDEAALAVKDPNKDVLKELFTELEFRNLASRVLGEEITITKKAPPTAQLDLFGDPEASMIVEQHAGSSDAAQGAVEVKTIADMDTSYKLIDTAEKRKELIAYLEGFESICFDTETTGLDTLEADVVGLAFSVKTHEAFYVPVPLEFEQAKPIVQEFAGLFAQEKKEFIAHNLKYDLEILLNYDVPIKGRLFDTMLAHYLIQPDAKHGMDRLAELYLNYKPISIETLIGKKGKNQKHMGELPPAEIVDYAAEDADITLQLKEIFQPKIEEEHLKQLFYNLETPLIPVLAAMEREGIRLDVENLKEFSQTLEQDLGRLHQEILDLAGMEFNIDSPKQLGEVLFEHMKITDKAKKTKTGQYSTSEDILEKLVHAHEIVPHIMEYRSLKKLKSTYVDTLPEMVNPKTQRIHTNYMQTVAATGRLSSNNPNLQNIPIRTSKGREIRKAFIPRDEEHVLLAADYSQIELRVIASLSGDQNMQAAFTQGADFHAATAARVFGVELDEVDREMRSKAKAVNFGIIYGQSAFGLSQKLNIKRREAKEIIDSYYEQFSTLKSYMEQNVVYAKEHGYVETIMQRRRYLKDINSSNAVVRGFAERNAVNAPVQGSAADIIKIAMIRVQEQFLAQQFKSKMLLQVHDELVFDVYKPELEEVASTVKKEMEGAVEMAVPLVVEMETAKNWLEAH